MTKQSLYRICGALAILGGVVGLLDAPLLAMSYFAIPDGAEFGKAPIVLAWTGILQPLVKPLLTFSSPDNVYAFYGWGMFPVFIGFAAGLIGLHSLQASHPNRWEKTGYWLYLVSSILYLLGIIGAYGFGALDLSFFAFLVPGLLLGFLGISSFGIGTLKAGMAPHSAAWLFILGGLPGMILLGILVGHNSGRFLLADIAWIIIGAWMWAVSNRADPAH